jgi:hypothetical protein
MAVTTTFDMVSINGQFTPVRIQTGDTADDTIFLGSDFPDVASGGGGNDIFVLQYSSAPGSVGFSGFFDTIQGGDGTDAINYSNLTLGVNVDLNAGTARGIGNSTAPSGLNQTIDTVEVVVGTGLLDILRGGVANETMYGGGGDDVIDGRGGADWVLGQAGNDILLGGAGSDVIDGGADDGVLNFASPGSNPFVFNPKFLASGIIAGDWASHSNATQAASPAFGQFDGVVVDLNGAPGTAGLTNPLTGTPINQGSASDPNGFNRNLGEAQGDSYWGIENVNGSRFADLLIGQDGVSNVIRGGLGNDELVGGTNQLNGADRDIFDFSGTNAAINNFGDTGGVDRIDDFDLGQVVGNSVQASDLIDLRGHVVAFADLQFQDVGGGTAITGFGAGDGIFVVGRTVAQMSNPEFYIF